MPIDIFMHFVGEPHPLFRRNIFEVCVATKLIAMHTTHLTAHGRIDTIVIFMRSVIHMYVIFSSVLTKHISTENYVGRAARGIDLSSFKSKFWPP